MILGLGIIGAGIGAGGGPWRKERFTGWYRRLRRN